MQRTGVASLPLHYGKAPRWLTVRMQALAKQMATVIVDELGPVGFLRRISDPFWFQAFGCVLGYDWHSSGVTTVVTGVLKQAVTPEEHGIAVCGGKGHASRQTPAEIEAACERFCFGADEAKALSYASRLSAKVDSTAIQAGYQLYHHAFFVAEDRKWAVVQQGMCFQDRTARRFHWLSDSVQDFAVEPHSAIVGETRHRAVLDMTAAESESCRKTSVDLAKESPEETRRLLTPDKPTSQRSLYEWVQTDLDRTGERRVSDTLLMPGNVNWKALQRVYEFQPSNYEELLAFRGVGPATIRGLALVAELVYGNKPSWKDPVKFSFAYGGKDGVPYPVDRKAMDESIHMLRHAVEEAKLGKKEKLLSLQRLRAFVPSDLDV